MIRVTLKKSYNCQRQDLFSQFQSMQKLLAVKKNFAAHRIARDEPGLQIVDTSVRILFLSYGTRLKYTTRPETSAELKQIHGKFREYLCLYEFMDSGINTDLTVSLRIKFPLGPIGFLVSLLLKPVVLLQFKRELKRIEKQTREMKAH
jgi:hypothetical protein